PRGRDHGRQLRAGSGHRGPDPSGPSGLGHSATRGKLMQASLPTMEARTGRGTQLALTLFAVTLSVGAYVLVTLGKTGKTPPGIARFVAVIAASYLAAHFLVT